MEIRIAAWDASPRGAAVLFIDAPYRGRETMPLDRLADRHRDGEHRFQDVFGVRDLERERNETRTGSGPRSEFEPTGDALPD